MPMGENIPTFFMKGLAMGPVKLMEEAPRYHCDSLTKLEIPSLFGIFRASSLRAMRSVTDDFEPGAESFEEDMAK